MVSADTREAALALNPRDRIRLADDLYGSVDANDLLDMMDPDHRDAWVAECRRRAADARKSDSLSVDEFWSELKRRHPGLDLSDEVDG